MTDSATGGSNLLAPENCRMLLIDHEPVQFAGVQNIDRTLLVNNVVGLAKTAKVFGVPTILTTVLEQRGGYLLKDIQDVFPDQKPTNRTTLNTWEDERVVNVVKKIGRKKLVIAALWTEICLAYPVLSALGEGYEVFIVTDASGGVSVEAHERAVQRMVQAGAAPPHMDRIRKQAAARLGAREDDSRNQRNHGAARRRHRHQSHLIRSTAGV